MLNLAINARDAMLEGGLLSSSTRRHDALPTDVAVAFPALPSMAYMELTAQDDGSGMSDHVRARAFEHFFMTREACRGSELAERVEQRWPSLPLLLMTGYAADAEVHTARWPVLTKPFQRAALIEAVATALG